VERDDGRATNFRKRHAQTFHAEGVKLPLLVIDPRCATSEQPESTVVI